MRSKVTNNLVVSEFRYFLISHGAWCKFRRNMQKEGKMPGKTIQSQLQWFFLHFHPLHVVSLAFNWHLTDEGFSYWSNMRERWAETYSQIYDIIFDS